jgi:hypothetical protein
LKFIAKCTVSAWVAALGVSFAQGAQQTAVWNGGSGTWTNTSMWSGGTVPNNTGTTTYAVLIDNGKPGASTVSFFSASGTVDALTIDAGDTLNLSSVFDTSLTILSGPTVNGTLNVTTGTLTLGNNPTITGTGQVGFLPNGSGTIRATSGTLTIGSGITVGGSGAGRGGTIGDVSRPLAVAGTATASGLNYDLGLFGSTFANSGMLEVSNSATITINSNLISLSQIGPVTNTGGTIRLAGTLDNSGNTLTLDGARGRLSIGGMLRGGTVVAAGGNELLVERNPLLLDGVTLNAPMRVRNTSAMIAAGQTFTGAADVILESEAFLRAASGDTTIGPNIHIMGDGYVGSGNGGKLVNYGRITSSGTGPNGWMSIIPSGAIENHGIIEAVNGGTLRLGGVFTVGGLGTISSANPLVITGTLNNTGQTLVNGAPHKWQFAGGTITGGTVEASAANPLIVPDYNQARLEGVTLSGVLQIGTSDYAYLELPNGISGSGVITGAARIRNFEHGIFTPIVIGAGITVTGGSTEITNVVNHGVIEAERSRLVSLLLGVNPATPILINDGTLHIKELGRINSMSIRFDDGGALDVELGGISSQAMFTVTGDLNLGDDNDFLNITRLSFAGNGPHYLASYSGTRTGIFDHVTPGYIVDYSTPNKIFVSVPEPSAAASALVAVLSLLAGPRKRESHKWYGWHSCQR